MKLKFLTIYITIFTIITYGNCYAAEIDSYSGTDEYIWPASGFINENINNRLEQAVNRLNLKQVSCVSNQQDALSIYEVIQEELIKDISSFYVGHFIANYFNDHIPDDEKIIIPFEQSIYKDMSFIDGISLKLKGTLGLIKVNGYFHKAGANYIGMDKLGHFFVEGHSFFEKAYLEPQGNIKNAIQWGKKTEEGKFGLITTGVFSHADLVANFNGMRFWNQIFHFNKDPLDNSFYHNRPYLKCRINKWKLQKYFDIDEYTDAAWDEKINCNEYRNEEIKLKILKGFENAYDAESWEGFCPAIKKRCRSIIKKYKYYAKDLIEKSCLSIQS